MVQQKQSGRKAVAFMTIEALVEIDENGEYYIMVEDAELKLRKHVVDGNGFIPFRSTVNIIQEGVTVKELANKLTIQPGSGWHDK